MLYSEKVMDHFHHPRNVGEIANPSGVGEVGNPTCGDVMKIYLKVNDDGIIEDVKFNTYGCGSAIASSSMATELIKGKSIDEAAQLTNKAVAEALDGLPAHKLHCSVLAEQAIRAAIEDYYRSHGISYDKKTLKRIISGEREKEASPVPENTRVIEYRGGRTQLKGETHADGSLSVDDIVKGVIGEMIKGRQNDQ